MEYDEPDYSKVSHDELLALAKNDSVAAQEFFNRYQYSDDPVLKTEVREVLRSLAEDLNILASGRTGIRYCATAMIPRSSARREFGGRRYSTRACLIMRL